MFPGYRIKRRKLEEKQEEDNKLAQEIKKKTAELDGELKTWRSVKNRQVLNLLDAWLLPSLNVIIIDYMDGIVVWREDTGLREAREVFPLAFEAIRKSVFYTDPIFHLTVYTNAFCLSDDPRANGSLETLKMAIGHFVENEKFEQFLETIIKTADSRSCFYQLPMDLLKRVSLVKLELDSLLCLKAE